MTELYDPSASNDRLGMFIQNGFQLPNWGNSGGYAPVKEMGFNALPSTVAAAKGGGGDWVSRMIGTPDAPGWGGLALGAAQGLGNAFMGMKQYGLAKKTLKENKRQFQENFNAQKKTTNASLEDRQRARVAANSGGYESVGDYMNKYRI